MGRTMEFKLTKVPGGGVGDRSKLNWQAGQFKIRFRRPNPVLRLRRKAKGGPGRAAGENPLRICNIWRKSDDFGT
jgi:hypothetical protein